MKTHPKSNAQGAAALLRWLGCALAVLGRASGPTHLANGTTRLASSLGATQRALAHPPATTLWGEPCPTKRTKEKNFLMSF